MTKPHFRIRSDGWIVHDGSEMPVPPWQRVAVRTTYGGNSNGVMIERAGYFAYEGRYRVPGFDMWRGKWGGDLYRITAYRLA